MKARRPLDNGVHAPVVVPKLRHAVGARRKRALGWALGLVVLGAGLAGCSLHPGHGSTTTTLETLPLVPSTVALPSTVFVPVPSTTGGQPAVPTSGPSNDHPADLVGDWLGPFPGPAGKCSYEYAEWFIYAAGSYTSTWNSSPLDTVAPPPAGTTTTAVKYQNGCEGGVTSFGTWSVQGNLLTFHQQGNNCPECVQAMDIPVKFSFVDGDLRICDPVSGGCWDYARQQGSARKSDAHRRRRPPA